MSYRNQAFSYETVYHSTGKQVCLGTPSSSQCVHPHFPLNCFMFKTLALAGKSTVHISSLALETIFPDGVLTAIPNSISVLLKSLPLNKVYTSQGQCAQLADPLEV